MRVSDDGLQFVVILNKALDYLNLGVQVSTLFRKLGQIYILSGEGLEARTAMDWHSIQVASCTIHVHVETKMSSGSMCQFGLRTDLPVPMKTVLL